MSGRSRAIRVVLLAAFCFSVLTSALQAAGMREPVADEIRKMEEAMPKKAVVEPAKPRRLLVFDLCGPNGFRHSCIPYWDRALAIMGRRTGAFSVVVSRDMNMFRPENLGQFDAVCLNNTTRLPFSPDSTPELCKSLMDFVKGGKGIIGIHAATDNFYQWPEAMEMMGGKFTGHPWGGGGTWAMKIDEPDHPLMKSFEGKGFKIKDEIYRTDPPLYSRDKQLVLMSLDVSDPATRNVKDFRDGDEDTGISWVKTWGKGRVFYCSLGHDHAVTWNPAVLWHYLAGIQFALGDFKVGTQPKPVVSSEKGSEMEQLLEKVKKYDFGQSREALTEVSDTLRKAYGKPADLRRLEKSLVEVLKSDATYAGKQFVCRELSVIGTEQCVSALGQMLTDPKLSDMARYALERIPGDAVDNVLREALGKTSGKTRIGVVNTLGERRDRRAVSAIGKLVSDSDETMAAAAISALGKIGDPDAIKVLAKAKGECSGKLRMVVLDAYLKCAENLLARGEKAGALAIYRELYKQDEPQLIRTAAMRGIVSATGSQR